MVCPVYLHFILVYLPLFIKVASLFCYNDSMEQLDIIDEYLGGEEIDPCKHSQFEMEKLAEFLGDDIEY